VTPKFPKEELDGRLGRFRKAMSELDIEVSLVHTPENICYLTGHETPGYYAYQCLVVSVEADPILVLRETEMVNAREYTYLERIEGYTDAAHPVDATAAAVRKSGLSSERVGLEQRSWFLPPLLHRRLVELMNPGWVVQIDGTLASLRLVKSLAEVEAIKGAARITNAAMAAAASAAEAGSSERQVAARAFATLVEEGSEYLGMEPFVASGQRSGAIHASWSDRNIAEGEPVLIELAASVKRYHAALMHTVATGPLPPELEALRITCADALAATLGAVRPGATAEGCHKACLAVIEEAGLLEHYRKRTGYSIGLAFAPDWGEGHLLSLGGGETTPLVPGMVLHVVPALRIPGVGGVGFSATVLVTPDGHEVLTSL
jgi:Xaa-Pro dipeptidase